MARSIITGAQIRAARAMLRWTAAKLADTAGLSHPTIKRIERVDGLPDGRGSTLSRIEEALRAAGIEFTGGPADAPGVRMHGVPGSRPSS